MPPFADDIVVPGHDGSDDRVRIRRPTPTLRELERPLEM
jgi:hypothetical protein